MNLVKTKKKSKYKLKYIICLVIIYLSFSYTFYNMIKGSKAVSNEEFINILVSSGNANILSKYKTTNIINGTMKFLLNIDFTNPKSILNNSILKYGSTKKKKTEATISISYNDDYSDMDELKKVSDYIKDPNPKEIKKPLVYLYNTHQLENYNNDNLEIYGITPNVQMASYLLREKLDSMGISTIVEDANMSNILASNNWNYAYSYQASASLITDKKNKYPTLKYFIDIHRDSIPKSASTASLNNKNYAKILFVVGKDYNTWQDNYNFSNKLNDLLNTYYSGISRGIITKSGTGVNGIYNQNLSPNCILIEVGGNENTIEEVYNTIEVLADILNKYISGAVK